MLMDENERRAYIRYLEDLTYQNDVLKCAYLDGYEIGLAKGLAKSQAEDRAGGLGEVRESRSIEIAKTMKTQGCSSSLISTCTGLKEEEIEKL